MAWSAGDRIMSTATEIEAVLFKPVAGGYLFQQANPWVFGPTRRYVVSETQKAALLAIVTPRRPVIYITLITAAILAWTAAIGGLLWAVTGHPDPTALDVVAWFALILVPLYLVWVAVVQRKLRRMQPILAAAAPSQERFTNRELRRAMGDAMSVKKTALLMACWIFTFSMQGVLLVTRNARHPLFSDVQSYMNLFTAVVAAGLAAYYLMLVVRKLRQRPAAI
jgi:hypothetical protein